jgi:hypothetical protein
MYHNETHVKYFPYVRRHCRLYVLKLWREMRGNDSAENGPVGDAIAEDAPSMVRYIQSVPVYMYAHTPGITSRLQLHTHLMLHASCLWTRLALT